MNAEAWRYYSRFYREARPRLIGVLAISTAQSFVHLPILLLIRYAFDDLITSSDLTLLSVVGVVLVILHLVIGPLSLYTRHVVLQISKRAIENLRAEILKKFYTFSRSYYSQVDRSRLHTIMVQDTERVDVMTNGVLAQLIASALTSVILGAILLYLNWMLFLVMLGVMPVLLALSRWLGRLVGQRTHAFHRSFETFSRGVSFVLQMMDLTRTQSAEHLESERQRESFKDLRSIGAQMAWLRTAYGLLQDTIVATSAVVILIVGGAAVATEIMTLGELVSFYAAVALLRPHAGTVLSSIPQIIEGNESLTTLYDLLHTEDARPYVGREPIDFKGGIVVEAVHFAYGEAPLLRDVSIEIPPGVCVAIIGPNGAGKSTIASLILGFYRPQRGALYADGHPFTEMDIVGLRRRIGVVAQSPPIFPGTILQNITYGNPDLGLDQVVRAARVATADDFIRDLPQGYETAVGEGGVLLSGGAAPEDGPGSGLPAPSTAPDP